VRVRVRPTQSGGMAVELEGPVTQETVPEIRRDLFRKARNSGGSHFAVDLSGVSFMDTAGLAMLVELLSLTSKMDTILEIWGANTEIKRMVQLAGLDAVLPVRD
jgi:anti-anti-sigma factor